MGYTGIIATQLTDHATHPWGLYIDGLDVIKEHATPSRFGVPLDSISVTEAGPGGVSSMSFSIDDPSLALSFADSARIEYWDLTLNLPIFAGFLQTVAIIDDFGQQGRTIEVTAYGLEALLDTVIVPSFTAHDTDTDGDGFRTHLHEYLQLFASYAPLRASTSPLLGGSVPSNQATPIENFNLGNYAGLPFGASVNVSGQSIRSAFESLAAAMQYAITGVTATIFLSVDFYAGVRAFLWAGTAPGLAYPTDWTNITLSDAPGGTLAASNIRYEKDLSPGSIVNAVYVQGATAASTGWVLGDTSTGRRETSATTSGTAEADKQAAGAAILSNRGTAAGRGSFDLFDWAPTNTHPGARATITDAIQGWAGKVLTITEISKTFHSNGKQDWHVSFMDPAVATSSAGPPSAARLVRTLTRGTN